MARARARAMAVGGVAGVGGIPTMVMV